MMFNVADEYVATAPEPEIARDLAKRALPVGPVIIVGAGLIWGVNGALSATYAVLLVVVNFLLAAAIMARAARVGPAALMAATLFGYIIRLGLITAAVLLVRGMGWVNLVAMGVTLVVTHLVLLVWETKFVSASLAFPGLKPVTGSSVKGNVLP